ncbi:MAG: type II secretion system F family protein [Sulfolobaceae archaeon]|nr:type II secretion system F family protein [Sulfolobaceae archaeon]
MEKRNNKIGRTTLNSYNIDMIFYRSSLAKSLAKNFEEKLKLAGLPDDPQLYASKFLFYMLISIIVTILLLTASIKPLLLYKSTHLVKYAVLGLILLIFGVLIPVIVYLSLDSQISQRIERRRIGIDAEMGVFSSVFVIFLRSGLNPKSLFENLSKAKALTYISSLSTYISRRIKYLGEGTEEAIDNAIKVSPSKMFKDYMTAYISAVRTGAPVLNTMESETKNIIRQIELRANISTDRLSGIAETYVIWLASGYITFFLLIILGAIFPTSGLTLSFGLMAALVVVLVPLVNLLFVYMVDSIQFKLPEPPLKAYKYFYISFAVSFIASFIVLWRLGLLISLITLTGGVNEAILTAVVLTMGISLGLVPPLIIAEREIRRGTGYDNYTVNFLRAIAEGLRAGLSPETIIKNLKDDKEMGKLSTILKQIYTQLMVGVPLRDAVRIASKEVRDFATKISLMMLGDMIEIGSMTPESIEVLADQISTQIRVKNEYISKTKLLLYAPYVGIVLALVASILLAFTIYNMLLFEKGITLYGPLASALSLLPRAIYALTISSIFNSFLAGFLIGKLSSGRIANGFLHSILLLIITLLLILIMVHIKFQIVPPKPVSI